MNLRSAENFQLCLKMEKNSEIPMENDTQVKEESIMKPISNLNQEIQRDSENEILHKSMGTVELCYDSDSDIGSDIIEELKKKCLLKILLMKN